jgi:predicted ATPase
MPELLRIKGELLGAEEWFIRSLDLARRQGALAWELRAATSLARPWRGKRRAVQARALLAEVYGKFTEGFATADMRAAQELLRLLS